MNLAPTETRRQRRERLYGPAAGKPNKRLCPARPAPAEKPAPRYWDPVTALRLWNGGLFGDWREFDFKRIRRVLVRPCLPYRN
jgi:hypothetical protein